MIIALEGLDNAGKTTLMQKISDKLNLYGYRVENSKELSTSIGLVLKEGLKISEYSPVMKALLFAADRQKRIEDLGDIVIDNIVLFDRYYPSAIAYRTTEGLDEEWIRSINHYNPKMDVGIYIDITPEESISRNIDTKFNIHYCIETLEKIRENYLKLVKKGELSLVNGMQEKDDVLEDVMKIIDTKICNKRK